MLGRRFRLVALLIGGVALLVSCNIGVTGRATDVRDTSARLQGEVYSERGGSVVFWFEYGTTRELGQRTADTSADVSEPESATPVSAKVTGLTEGTKHYFRTCAQNPGEAGTLCGSTRELTTTSGHDYVTGQGIVDEIPQLGYYDGSVVDVQVDQDGSSPTGTVATSPGVHYFRIPDEGPLTCVRVDGNRAVVGFLSDTTEYDPTLPLIPILAFYEDNGATGDRFFDQTLDEPTETCPDPDDIDQPGHTLIEGDFVVHDHPSPT